jgi:pilus assembly protein Flp/PilA
MHAGYGVRMNRIGSLWIALQNAVHRSLTAPRPRTRRGEEGQGMVEYALVLVLIAVVVIVTVALVGKKVSNVFSNISSGLGP